MRLYEKANYDFIKFAPKAYITSAILLGIGILSIIFQGFSVGIDFKGGKEYVYGFSKPVSIDQVRTALSAEKGLEVKNYGSANDIMIRTGNPEEDVEVANTRIKEALSATFKGNIITELKSDKVGARISKDILEGAYYSIIFGLLVIFAYVSLRFEWRFAAGAITALFHDVFIALGALSLFHKIMPFSLTIDQTVIAAILTIIGFSINDTVVIFDRIREQQGLKKGQNMDSLVNESVNINLGRTVVTSLTVFMTICVLLIFGGEVLSAFAFCMFIGVISGVYSTVFIASPVMLWLYKKFPPAVKLAKATTNV